MGKCVRFASTAWECVIAVWQCIGLVTDDKFLRWCARLFTEVVGELVMLVVRYALYFKTSQVLLPYAELLPA